MARSRSTRRSSTPSWPNCESSRPLSAGVSASNRSPGGGGEKRRKEEGRRMKQEGGRIAIVGFGLIGASLGLAVKRRWPAAVVIGIDEKPVTERAMRMQAAD